MPRKRKAAEDGDAGAAATVSPVKKNAPLDEGNEMERQLSAHAASAYNDFVRFFQRRASVRPGTIDPTALLLLDIIHERHAHCLCATDCGWRWPIAQEHIAANRVFIVTHQQFAAARRRSYPMAASLPYHRAMLNISYVESACRSSSSLSPPVVLMNKLTSFDCV